MGGWYVGQSPICWVMRIDSPFTNMKIYLSEAIRIFSLKKKVNRSINLTLGIFKESDETFLKEGRSYSVIQILVTLFIKQSSCFTAVMGVKSAFRVFTKNPLHCGKNSLTTCLLSSTSPKNHLLMANPIRCVNDCCGYINASY